MVHFHLKSESPAFSDTLKNLSLSLSLSLITDYPQASATFSVVRTLDPYRTTNMDTFSDVLFVMVQKKYWEGLGTV